MAEPTITFNYAGLPSGLAGDLKRGAGRIHELIDQQKRSIEAVEFP